MHPHYTPCDLRPTTRAYVADLVLTEVDHSGTCWLWRGDTDRYGYARLWLPLDGQWKSLLVHRLAYSVFVAPIPEGLWVLHTCAGDYEPGDMTSRRCVNPGHLYAGTPEDNTRDMVEHGRQASGERNGMRVHPESVVRGAQHHWHLNPQTRSYGERNGTHTHPERLARGEEHHTHRHPEWLVRGDAHWTRTQPDRLARGPRHGRHTHPERTARGERHGRAKLSDTQVAAIRARHAAGESGPSLAREYGVSRHHVWCLLTGKQRH